MRTPNNTHINLIKEKMNHEYTSQNINGEKQEWVHQIARLTIWFNKRQIMNTHLKQKKQVDDHEQDLPFPWILTQGFAKTHLAAAYIHDLVL